MVLMEASASIASTALYHYLSPGRPAEVYRKYPIRSKYGNRTENRRALRAASTAGMSRSRFNVISRRARGAHSATARAPNKSPFAYVFPFSPASNFRGAYLDHSRDRALGKSFNELPGRQRRIMPLSAESLEKHPYFHLI